MIGLQLSKSVKSLQVRLNESLFLSQGKLVTASAYSQARQKYRHTAFIELSDVTRDYYYAEANYSTWQNMRVIAVDGSTLALPYHSDTVEEFGTQHIPATKHQSASELPMCRLLASYDVLNHIIHDCTLSHCKSYEVSVAEALIGCFSQSDVMLFDRHYASYDFIAKLALQGYHFVIRCPKSTFREGSRVFEGGPWTRRVTLTAPGGTKKTLQQQGLPIEVDVRFVRVKLANGENEVLVTSLQNESLKANDFHYLYGLRWGIETLYRLLKTRLNIENFSGYCPESVKQDIFASIFITNMESLLTDNIEEKLKKKSANCQYQKKVNKAISFNAIKHEVFNLLYNFDMPIDDVLEKLTTLFVTNPVLIKPERVFERNKSGPNRKLRHYKSKNKFCF